MIRENATNTRSADGEWKLTPEKFMKVVRKMLNTKTEEEFDLLRDVRNCAYAMWFCSIFDMLQPY